MYNLLYVFISQYSNTVDYISIVEALSSNGAEEMRKCYVMRMRAESLLKDINGRTKSNSLFVANY